MRDIVTAILGGGRGTRLWPLTRDRAKPAVPVAGKFRLIDVPISNSLQAGIDRIYVLTQFNSASLHRHIAQTYRFDAFSQGWVNVLAAEQNVTSSDWYLGTADAVRRNLRRLEELGTRDILILSGDQLYLMDLPGFIEAHRRSEADLTIAVKPVSSAEASGLGIVRIDRGGRIVEFVEKPSDPDTIRALALDQTTVENLGLEAEAGELLASMGIYVFRTEVLGELLTGTTATDFGKEVIPSVIHDRPVSSFVHDGYWRDIGTIGAFHQANLDLTAKLPALDLYSESFPIYTHPRFLPATKINHCELYQSILSDGSIISGSRIRDSIIGVRGQVEDGSVIESSIVMGANTYDRNGTEGVHIGVGRDCRIRRAIIDMDARIGDGSRLLNEQGLEHADADNYSIREGIIVVPRKAVLPPGTVI